MEQIEFSDGPLIPQRKSPQSNKAPHRSLSGKNRRAGRIAFQSSRRRLTTPLHSAWQVCALSKETREDERGDESGTLVQAAVK